MRIFCAMASRRSYSFSSFLLADRGDRAGADSAAAFANREAHALLDGDRGDQLDVHLDVVARHAHLHALGQADVAGHVGGADVELGTVPGEERRGAGALLPAPHIHPLLDLWWWCGT